MNLTECTIELEYSDETSTYRLCSTHGAIESPDGEGGWSVVDTDPPPSDDVSWFEYRCDLLSEELRVLMADFLRNG